MLSTQLIYIFKNFNLMHIIFNVKIVNHPSQTLTLVKGGTGGAVRHNGMCWPPKKRDVLVRSMLNLKKIH